MLQKNTGFLFLIIVLVVAGCNSKELARLQIENDSLRNALNSEQAAMKGVQDVKMWLDSIDANRESLVSDLAEGTSREEFSRRLADINEFVKTSEDRIAAIQNALKSSDLESSAYLMLVDALRNEVQLRVDKLVKLNEQVQLYKSEKEGLEEIIKIKEIEVDGLRRVALTKDHALFLLEAKIQAMVDKLKAAEADAYYAQARAVEETARRTKLAPRKKRETYKEALELYKKAVSLGKREARNDIVRLDKTNAD